MEYTIERLKKCMPLTEGTYEEIDKDMIPILTELNEKGYLTYYSCQGHVRDGNFDAYITFMEKYNFPEEPFYSAKKVARIGGYVYRWHGVKRDTDEESENGRKILMAGLLEWAKNLPEREIRYDVVGIKKTKNFNFVKKWLGRNITKEEVDKIVAKKEYDGYDIRKLAC